MWPKKSYSVKKRSMESTLLTQDVPLQHSKQVAYQTGIWITSNISQPELPSTEGYGWQLNEQCKWSSVWITFQKPAMNW